MRVTVLCFARLRAIVGQSELTYDVPPGSTVADVWRRLIADHPEAAGMASSISSARNAEFAPMKTQVSDGDEVAFLPPVSGGATTI